MTNSKLPNVSTKEFAILILFIGTLAISGFMFYELQNTVQTYLKTQDNIASLQGAMTQNAVTVGNFKKESIIQSWLTDSLPTQITLVNWIQQMDTTATNAGVTQSLSFSSGALTKNTIVIPQGTESGSLPSVGFTVVISGSYDNILSYIALLNHSYYYTKITQINFSANGGSTVSNSGGSTVTVTPAQSSGAVTATLNGVLYVDNTSVQNTIP